MISFKPELPVTKALSVGGSVLKMKESTENKMEEPVQIN
jgi:hypothetical protein